MGSTRPGCTRVTNATTLAGLRQLLIDLCNAIPQQRTNHKAYQQHGEAVPGGGAGTWVVYPILNSDHVIKINEN